MVARGPLGRAVPASDNTVVDVSGAGSPPPSRPTATAAARSSRSSRWRPFDGRVRVPEERGDLRAVRQVWSAGSHGGSLVVQGEAVCAASVRSWLLSCSPRWWRPSPADGASPHRPCWSSRASAWRCCRAPRRSRSVPRSWGWDRRRHLAGVRRPLLPPAPSRPEQHQGGRTPAPVRRAPHQRHHAPAPPALPRPGGDPAGGRVAPAPRRAWRSGRPTGTPRARGGGPGLAHDAMPPSPFSGRLLTGC